MIGLTISTQTLVYRFSVLLSLIDQHLISPHSNTAESVLKVVRIGEMITNLKALIGKQILLVITEGNA